MATSAEWVQPRENTIEAISYGIQVSDGVEFDLRLTEDKQLVLHHDSKTEFGDYPETMLMDELPDYVETFDDLFHFLICGILVQRGVEGVDLSQRG